MAVEAGARRTGPRPPSAPGAAQLGQRARGVVSLHLRNLAREGRMTVIIGRRELLAAFGGTAATWPLAARAQQPNRMLRIGVLTPYPADDAEARARLTAFAQGLAQTGWTVGQNIRIDYRWGDGKPDTMRKYAAELVALAPEHDWASHAADAFGMMCIMYEEPVRRPDRSYQHRFHNRSWQSL
jgi:hypothetical protein